MSTSRVTTKGQVTLPKEIRDALGVRSADRVAFEIDGDEKKIVIKKAPDIMELAGKHKAPSGKSALKARKYIEENYKRS